MCNTLDKPRSDRENATSSGSHIKLKASYRLQSLGEAARLDDRRWHITPKPALLPQEIVDVCSWHPARFPLA